MTVKDLISELKQLPQDVPVISNYKEITDVDYADACYIIGDYDRDGYIIGAAVTLE